MSAVHTPGPWLIIDGNFVYKLHAVDDVNRFYAQVCSGYASGRRTSKEEISANARLMAAAPDLLAALDKAINMVKSKGGMDQAIIGEMYAAWRKAKGIV